jgi:diacylglycerol O-acyltransferase / wax synthase
MDAPMKPRIQHLSGLDASFLHMETPEMPMHVGALHVCELPADYTGSFVDDIRAHIATRLPLVSAMRRRLEKMPLNLTNPVWVDAQPDLNEHIVSVKLRKGSSVEDVEARIGQLHTVLLDRSRPLWKFHVFEGLKAGPGKTKRYALYTQLHHAAVDGQAAVALANAILDTGPVPRDVKIEPRAKRSTMTMSEMLSGVLVNQLQQYANIVKGLPATVGALTEVARKTAASVGSSAASQVVATAKRQAQPAAQISNLTLAPRTRLNASVTSSRVFASVSLPLVELKALRHQFDATLNDVVLMVCSGALRRYFLQHGPLPRKSLIAAVPISLRAAGDASSNNQASMTVLSLGTHIANTMKRVVYIKVASAAMKANLGSVKSLMPTDFPSLGVPWLMSTAASLYGRAKVADRIPPIANVVISNVPGPAFPFYLAGAKMLTNFPTSIVVHGMGLNITVQTYNESLDVGLIACAEAAPHLHDLALHITAAFEELKALPPLEKNVTAVVTKNVTTATATRADAPKAKRSKS